MNAMSHALASMSPPMMKMSRCGIPAATSASPCEMNITPAPHAGSLTDTKSPTLCFAAMSPAVMREHRFETLTGVRN